MLVYQVPCLVVFNAREVASGGGSDCIGDGNTAPGGVCTTGILAGNGCSSVGNSASSSCEFGNSFA